MFAEFEWRVHQRAEQGEALTAEIICGLYLDLLRQYFGPDLVIDDYMKWEWTVSPIFTTPITCSSTRPVFPPLWRCPDRF
jgi:oligoendopeptidase F